MLSSMQDLERRVADLERLTRQIPSRWRDPPRIRRLVMGQGNEIQPSGFSTIYGVKAVTSAPSSLPSATPSLSAAGTYADGLASAYDIDTGEIVWVASAADPGSGSDSDNNVTVPESQRFISRRHVMLPYSGDLYPVYLVWYLG